MDVDAVIAEATAVAPEAKATEVATPVETSPEPVETEAPEVKPAVKPHADLTPEERANREANRVARQSRYEARLKRTNRELLAQVEQLRTQAQPSNPQNTNEPQPPRDEDYSDWDSLRAAERKYYRDVARWEAKQEFADHKTKVTQNTEAEKLTNYWNERKQIAATKEAEFASKVPDYAQVVYGEYGDFMRNLPLPVQEALIEADDAGSALYALATEGKLEDLEEMAPNRIALEIGRAEMRGKQYLNRKTTTNAPPPVEAARGTGKTGKDLIDLPMDVLLKKLTR